MASIYSVFGVAYLKPVATVTTLCTYRIPWYPYVQIFKLCIVSNLIDGDICNLKHGILLRVTRLWFKGSGGKTRVTPQTTNSHGLLWVLD